MSFRRATSSLITCSCSLFASSAHTPARFTGTPFAAFSPTSTRKVRPMNAHNDDLMKRIALGASAGVVGTAAIHALMVASEKFAPITVPLHRHDPGEFMVEQAEGVLPRETRYKVPAAAEKTAAVALSSGYGATFGA